MERSKKAPPVTSRSELGVEVALAPRVRAILLPPFAKRLNPLVEVANLELGVPPAPVASMAQPNLPDPLYVSTEPDWQVLRPPP